MKVVWISNVPFPDYLRYKNAPCPNVGGWMNSLLLAVRQFAPEIELAILFEGEHSESVSLNGVAYWISTPKELSANIRNLVDTFKPDIIHLHGSDGLSLKLPLGDFSHVPVCLSIQGVLSGYWPHYHGGLTGGELSMGRNRVREWLGMQRTTDAADLWRTTRAAAEQKVFAHADCCLGRTDWDKGWTNALAPNAKYFHVGEIMRPPFYLGGRKAADIRRHSIYCSAALSYPLKGGHWLLRAVAILKRKYPDIQLRVANAAQVTDVSTLKRRFGKNEYYRYLIHLIEELDIADNLVLLPSINADQVAEELRRAEVFCLPSMVENSPNSLGEAMLMGTPAIATYVGGVPSILKNGEEGELVPSGDCAALADAIDRYFSDPEMANRYATAAYKTAVVRYAPKNVVNDLMTAYNGALVK